MKITRYAQSTIKIEWLDKVMLFDPGSYNYTEGRLDRDSWGRVDLLILTHKHADHFELEAVKTIWEQSRPTILTVKEVGEQLDKAGIEWRLFGQNTKTEFEGLTVEGWRADHVVQGEAVDVFGAVFSHGTGKVYHASDTTYLDEKPLNCDLAFLPINNRGVAMGFEDAARFAIEMGVKIAVPVHYDSPKDSHINPSEWSALLENTPVKVCVMAFGESIDL